MYTELFTKLGLAKNEAKIYEVLLKYGETAVARISAEADINRRNVYDSLNRLIEKGLVFEIRQGKENLYQAVDPRKLMENIKEKESALEEALPNLVKMYGDVPHQEDVYIYRGLEGWKNYMRDILRVSEDVCTIGGKGAWTDKKIAGFFEQFKKQAEKKKINFKILFDNEIKKINHEILKSLGAEHRFLPEGYSSPSSIDIFGDYVVILSNVSLGVIDEKSTFTVIVNKKNADSFRQWFNLLWKSAKKNSRLS